MACTVIPLKGGAVVMCSRGRPVRVKCRGYGGCEGEVVALCDFPLKGAKQGETCSRTLCARHRRQLLPTGAPGAVDYCPAHAELAGW